MDYKEFLQKFPDNRATIDYFTGIRFPEGVTCPKCKGKDVKQRKKNPKFYHCLLCNYSFSILKDTIFEKSSTNLSKWFYAIYLFNIAKIDISATNFHREIGVTYKCAWRILSKIKKAGSLEDFKFS